MPAYQTLPRLPFATAPSPIEALPRLSAALGGPQIFVKRDDTVGPAGGGNKARKLEFLLADAKAKGADVILTCGALQSNHARLTAACAAKVGIDCVLVLQDAVDWREPNYRASGNMLLDPLLGAKVIVIDNSEDLLARLALEADKLATAGRKPYAIPVGGSNALGSLGYVECAREIAESGETFDRIVLATGSGGTQAGLLLGAATFGIAAPILGISVSKSTEKQVTLVSGLIEAARVAQPDLGEVPVGKILVDDRHYLPGYGIPNEAVREALSLCARLEGLLLDPVYTGKGMVGLIAGIREGSIGKDERVLFLHTGGSAGLYAYSEWLSKPPSSRI
ncbi:D-cysteine desulfhydrase family protein [Lacibacterium aquatile]|uniref:D-cysteine desulfhydrase family protein n=1 Tax=Lacibacterium aquatile TaxID=1168082 RepID=A0ABW5E0C5_9PROT